jgi:TolB-like protein
MSLLAELKRRKVIRVAVVYAATAFAVLQAADIMLPQMGVPEWGLSLVVALVVLGFPLALVLGWALEVTPEGIKRTEAAPAVDEPPPSLLGKRTVFAAVLLVVLGVGIGAGWFLRPASAPEVAPAAQPVATLATDAPVVTEKSIAVLPFADFSPARDQEWFADGLTEEILNALARTPDLLVTARTSSFRYKGSTLDIPQIAAELGVAHVLEGSIRSTPQRIRVTAQLIRAADGFHLWSETYDRDPADMIEIQEDLARNIALAMQTTMDPQALSDMARVGTRSVAAYQAYIRGVASRWEGGNDSFKEGYELFEKARALDAGFAAAHAQAAHFWLTQLDTTAIEGGLTDLSPAETEARFRERIRLAIDAASTPVERAGYEASGAMLELRWRKAIGLYQEFLAARPGDATAKQALLTLAIQASDQDLLVQLLETTWPETRLRRDMAIFHANQAHRSGNFALAADQAMALREWWPDAYEVLYQVHRALLWDRRVAVAAEVLERLGRVGRGDEQWGALPPARQACAEGRRDAAEQILANLDVDDISQRWHLLMLLGEQAAATELLMQLERDARTYALSSFLVYPHFDPSPFPSLMRILEREQVRRPPPVALPFACPPRGPVS